MRLFVIGMLLLLAACGRTHNSESVLRTYPSDPVASGWNEPLNADEPETEVLLSAINSAHDLDLAQLQNEVITAPVLDSEILAVDAIDERRPEERAHDNTEEQMQNAALEDYVHAYAHSRSATPKNWDGVLTSADLRSIRLGVSVSGPNPYAKKETEVFVPASITKSVTAALALERLGPNYSFETKISWQEISDGVAGNLLVVGSGDPTLGSTDFNDGEFDRLRQLIRDLKRAGVNEVRGTITMSSIDKRWDTPIHAPGVETKDNGWCYGALSQGFNLHSNCATVIVRGTTADWRDPGITVPIRTSIKIARKTVLSREIIFAADGSVAGFGLTGTVAKTAREFALSFPVPDVKSWLKNVIVRHMQEEGIKVTGGTSIKGTGPIKSVSSFSPALSEIIVPMLKDSDNFLADAVFKRMAVGQLTNRSHREAAQLVVAEGVKNWTLKAGFPHMKDEILLLDGAGLSRTNAATSRAFLALLKQHTTEAGFRKIWEALPIAGVDGTLKNRLKPIQTRGIVRAKTGTLRGSYQLAGFMPQFNADGTAKEFVPFVILTGTPDGFAAKVFKVQEKLLVRMGQILNPVLPPVSSRRP